jgi:hypothetical protein
MYRPDEQFLGRRREWRNLLLGRMFRPFPPIVSPRRPD